MDQPLSHRRHVPPLYGVMAEFENPTDLVAAARRVYSLGYRRINGYSPYPIEELSEAIDSGLGSAGFVAAMRSHCADELAAVLAALTRPA